MTSANTSPSALAEPDLPDGWSEIRIGDYFESWGGMTPSTSDKTYWNGEIPWISSKDVKQWRISEGQDFITNKALRETRLRLCPIGSVLVVVRSGILAHTLPIALINAEVTINQDLKAFYSHEPALNEWLALSLRAMSPDILGTNRKDGTTVQSVRYGELQSLKIPVPPLQEQKRIFEKMEQLLARVNTVREGLARVPTILKRFRQAVLASACSGRLTAEWRRSTEKLPSKMHGQRSSKIRTSNGTFSEIKGLFELPESWRWVSLESVCNDITVGHVGPMINEYRDNGIPFLRSQNVREFRFDPAGLKFISPEFHGRLRKTILHPGDVVVVRSGYAGIACVIPDGMPEANCADLVIIRPTATLNSAFACIFVNSNAGRAHVAEVKVGIAQSHFNIGAARKTPLPFPPLEEQQEIVRRVDALFILTDAIEKRVTAATARAEKLTQAILARAFRGALVPTEAELARSEGRTYESGADLLARIRSKQPVSVERGEARSKSAKRKSRGLAQVHAVPKQSGR